MESKESKMNIDDYLDELEKRAGRSEYMDGWNEETWQQEMESHPFFAKGNQDPNQELSPLMQGLQQLKYSPDENTARELAQNYREEGNRHFELKKYRFAIASYSEALKHARRIEQEEQEGQQEEEQEEKQQEGQEEENPALVEARLLSNRAAAQFHLGNLRSALIDCRLALKRRPQHVKAIIKGAQCALRLGRFDECLELCSSGQSLASSMNPRQLEELKSLCNTAKLKQKEFDRDTRKQKVVAKKRAEEEKTLYDTLLKRGIMRDDNSNKEDWTFEALESKHPTRLRVRLEKSEDNLRVVWPVLFVYPEYGQTDLIEQFDENNSFSDHLEVMFEEKPAWDNDKKYDGDKLKVYFEDRKTMSMIEVDKNASLGQTLKNPRLIVRDGMPSFVVLVDKSTFQKSFLAKYPNP